MNNDNTYNKINLLNRLWLWWEELGGVVAYDEKDCKPNKRPEFLLILIAPSLVIVMLAFMLAINP